MSVQAILPVLPLQGAICDLLASGPRSRGLYVSQRVFRVDGGAPDRLVERWEGLHIAHDALRTSLVTTTEGRLIQVVASEPRDVVSEHLNATGAAVGRRAVLLHDLRSRHISRLVEGGPPAALGVVSVAGESFVSVTWRHDLLDGTGVSALLGQLRSEAPPATSPSTASVLRTLLAREPIELGLRHLGGPPSRLGVFGAAAGHAFESCEFACSYETVERMARDFGVTVPTLVTAACVRALANLTAEDGFVLTAEDCRPIEFAEAVGMFTGVAAAWQPSESSSLFELAVAVQRQRASIAARRPVALTELLREAWSAGAEGFPDVLVTVHPKAGSLTSMPNWEVIDNVERTEFALSVDVVLDERVRVVLHRDVTRVSQSDSDELLTRIQGNLQRVDSPKRPSTWTARSTSPGDDGDAGTMQVALVAAICRQVLSIGSIGADTDLVAEGADSLAMMRLAVALCDAGTNVSVSTLFTHRTPRRIASNARTAVVAPPTQYVTSPIERSLLARTARRHLGKNPMLEQSVILIDEKLDADLFELAIRHVASEVDVFQATWLAGSHDELSFGESIEASFVDGAADAMTAAHALLQLDLERGLHPGDQLCRVSVVSDNLRSALAMSWHNAVLDGWSHATLIRFLQDAYRAAERGRAMPPPPGARIAEFRAWCERQHGGHAWWRQYLQDSLPLPVPDDCPADERSVSEAVFVATSAEVTDWLAQRTTLVVGAVTLVGHALVRATNSDSQHPVGVRLGLRPPELRGSLRMIGQATLEAPIRFEPSAGAHDCSAVSEALAGARDHGYIGEVGIREATGWGDDEDIFQLLVVPETELSDDEWAIRAGDAGGWREHAVWRREVSPSRVTAYIHVNETGVHLRVSVVEGDPQLLAKAAVAACREALTNGADRGEVDKLSEPVFCRADEGRSHSTTRRPPS